MIGTIFNTVMIIIGSTAGSIFKKGIKPAYHEILRQALGLAVVLLGLNTSIQHMPNSKYPVLFIVSLALGGLLGQWWRLEEHFDHLLARFSGKSNLAEGLSTAILLFCIGTLSIVGPIEAALKHNYTYLLTNGMLDGITSTVLASSFGIGIMAAAVVLFVWQGSIYLLATLMHAAISNALLNEISIVGGVLILASGLSILGIKKMHTLNLLPSLLVPPLFFAVLGLLHLG